MSKLNDRHNLIRHKLSQMFEEQIFDYDMFTDLGGNSIMALSLKEELAQNGIDISVNEILGKPIGTWGTDND